MFRSQPEHLRFSSSQVARGAMRLFYTFHMRRRFFVSRSLNTRLQMTCQSWLGHMPRNLLVFMTAAILFMGYGLLLAAAPQLGPVPPTTTSSTGRLTSSPPTRGDATHSCVNLYLANTAANQNPNLISNSYYRLHLLTNGPIDGGFTLSVSHIVRIIGV